MAHRVHPKIFRIENINDWQARWMSKKSFPKYLEDDFGIREFLTKRLKDASVESIEIERFPNKINIIINSSRPGFIIGRGGEEIEKIKKDINKVLEKIHKNRKNKVRDEEEIQEIRIEIREIRDPWSKASLCCQQMAQQIEKRLPHRRVLKQSLEKIMASSGTEGARVEVAGRLMGAEIARREWLKKGRLPRQTIRADIDYAQCNAHCTYGVIGVKVWLYKGDKF
jgi:small subunit ribosomal protein S3